MCNTKGAGKQSKAAASASIYCLTCQVPGECNPQSILCLFRLYTKPNWLQKRKIANDRKRARKRAKESHRTRYWRLYKKGEHKTLNPRMGRPPKKQYALLSQTNG